jgi:hypothetical protein
MRIFGTDISRQDILRRTGSLRQIGGIQQLSFEEGHGRGIRFLDVRTGAGFQFAILIDRGMDVGFCEFNGASLAWLPPKLFPGPWYFESSDLSWVRVGLGGLFNTAGLVTIGDPQTVDTEYYGFHARPTDRYGTHDRIALTPASRVTYGERWEGDRCILWAEGTVREEIPYGENLSLTRRYEAEVGGTAFSIRDTVTNDGFYPTPHQLLYHFNIGYPVVDDGAELLASVTGVVPGSMFEEGAAAHTETYRTFTAPQAGFRSEGYVIPMAADAQGKVGVGLVNRGFKGYAGGLGVYLRYDAKQLPTYIEWRMMGEGLYAVGMEPATNPFLPVPELEEAGFPIMLQPGETRVYDLEFGVLAGGAEINAFAAALPASSHAGI